jgi:hypothetical protein
VERDAAEEQARASSQKLRLVSDALPSLIAYVDREQRYRFKLCPRRKAAKRPPSP